MTINLSMPVTHELKPKITVIGVGGAGGNAVNNMITSHLEGVEFVACNTDAQALANCLTEQKIQLGHRITHGLGAGARPEVGSASAEESLEEILDSLQGSNMVFITAGMGGGTGTGAAPVIARAVREQGILTVGVVTKPFHFEGANRMRLAEGGLGELQKYVDTLIVIPNQNLFRMANEKTTFAEAFKMADEVLHMGVRGVTDLMMMPGLINLDFADIRTVMSEMGKAMMGTGEAEGDKCAIDAAEAAISNPLLDEVSMQGARGVLINITGGTDMTLFEVDAAVNRVREEVDADANIIFGSTFDESMQGRMRVSVVATGIDAIQKPMAVQGARTAQSDQAPEQVSSGWFPGATHKAQPFPQGQRPQADQVAQNMPSPAAHLRVAQRPVQEDQHDASAKYARRGFVMPPPQTVSKSGEVPSHDMDEPLIQEQETARQPSIFDRLGLAFSRSSGGHNTQEQSYTIQDEPLHGGAGWPQEQEQTATPSPRKRARGRDDISTIPAFLRREIDA